MWNSFQDDRDSGLFWLLSESIERLNKEYVESFFRDYRENFSEIIEGILKSKERL